MSGAVYFFDQVECTHHKLWWYKTTTQLVFWSPMLDFFSKLSSLWWAIASI